jgi:hypothetical protein
VDASLGDVSRPPRGLLPVAGRYVVIAIGLLWLVVLGFILRHEIFVSLDTVSNYGHVWWVGDSVRHGNGVPFHMPVIGHGEGLAFPYGFVPWATAGLLWPLLGDWVVTLWIAVGFVGLVAAMFWALPEIRRGWWAAVALVNPTLVMCPIVGQLPFMWAVAFLFLAIGCWRRDRVVWAGVFAAVAQATHPAMVAPILAVCVAGWLPFERHRRRLVVTYLFSALAALPAAWLVVASPVMGDTSIGVKVANFAGTLAVRIFVVVGPLLLTALRRNGHRLAPRAVVRAGLDWVAAGLVAFAIVLNVAFLGPFQLRYAWGALNRKPDRTITAFTSTSAFVPGLTYRLLQSGDAKLGMYLLVRAGGHLDSEFFPESIVRRSFRTTEQYSRFLRRRDVDTVVVFDTYDARWHTNEHATLDALAARASCSTADVGVTRIDTTEQYDVYRIQRSC